MAPSVIPNQALEDERLEESPSPERDDSMDVAVRSLT